MGKGITVHWNSENISMGAEQEDKGRAVVMHILRISEFHIA